MRESFRICDPNTIQSDVQEPIVREGGEGTLRLVKLIEGRSIDERESVESKDRIQWTIWYNSLIDRLESTGDTEIILEFDSDELVRQGLEDTGWWDNKDVPGLVRGAEFGDESKARP